MNTTKSSRARYHLQAALATVALVVGAAAWAGDRPVRYDLESQQAAAALIAFAEASGLKLVASSADLAGIASNEVRGIYPPEEALRMLLAGTVLEAELSSDGTVTVRRSVKRASLTRVAGPLMASATPSSATDGTSPAGPDPASSGDALEEVVVTARMRAEDLQEVPLSITAFSGDQLQRANVQNLRDIAKLTPGLTLIGDDSEREQRPTIRGLSFDGTYADESNVATFLDGIYLSNPNAVSLGILDFERVEVVKGPVSALYGRNAFSGAINYVSRQPTDELEARVEATAAVRNRYKVLGAVSGPIAEGVLSGRLTVGYDTYDGSYEDRVSGAKLGGFEKKNADVALRFTPTDRITVTGGFYYGNDDFDLPPVVRVSPNCAPTPTGTLTLFCGRFPDGDEAAAPQAPGKLPAFAAGNSRDVQGTRAKATFDLDAVTVDVLAGYFKVDAYNFVELNGTRDGLPFALIPGPGTVNLATYLGNVTNTSDTSYELRVSSKSTERLRWAVGGFQFRSSQDIEVRVSVDASPVPAGRQFVCPGNLACLWATPDGSPSADRTAGTGHTEQTSGFGSLEFDVTDALTVGAEVRRTKERKDTNVASVAGAPGVDPDGPGKEETWSFTTPRFTANYKLTPDVMIYASAAKGVKAGGFNQRASIPSELGYGPESNWTYEIGAKNTFLDGRVRANIALFSIDWKDLQVQGPSDNPNELGFVTKNFGSVKATGGEFEVAMLIARGASVNLGVAYTNPEFQSDAFNYGSVLACSRLPSCAPRITTVQTPQGPRQAVSLNGLLRRRASEWQGTAQLNFERPLTDTWDWFTNATYAYSSLQYQPIENYNWIGSRNDLGVRAGVQQGDLRISLWVENALDDSTAYLGGDGNIELNTFGRTPSATLPDQRRYGLTVSTRF